MDSIRASLRALRMRLVGLLRPTRADEEFRAELDSHIAMDTEAGVRAGLTPKEARRQALIRLHGAEQTKQALRERRTVPWLESLIQDARFGLRTLRRSPGFTVTAVLTLGVGIGACTAIFSLVNAVLLRSLPYGDPERLVYLFTPNPDLKIPDEVACPGYADFYDIKHASKSYADMTAYEQAMFSLSTRGTMQRIGGARVDEGFFSTLESAPELGRALAADDNQPGHSKVAVISHSLSVSMFGKNADVLNHSIQLDGASYQIVGVMPPGFEYPLFGSDLPYGNSHIKSTNIWVPLALTPKEKANRDIGDDVAVARLRPGVSIEQAQSEFSTMMANFDRSYPSPMGNWGALVKSFTGVSIGPVRPLMELLIATVFLVLLIACGNAANLLLARAAGRARELGVRAALGAGRGRILRQLLTESLLIGLAGGVAGIALTFLFLRLLPHLDPGNIPRLNQASLDSRVLLVALAVSTFTSAFSGLFPAMAASRIHLTDFLKTNDLAKGGAGHGRLQGALIVAQTAMVVLLLSGAGLLIRSYINVVSVDTGFSQSAVTMNIGLDARYRQPLQNRAFFKNLMARIGALPGVNAVGAVSDLPLSHSESLSTLWVDGFPNKTDQTVEARSITPQYFSAMSIPLIAGRTFTEDDVSSAVPRIVVNQQFAKTYFANRSPIGARISTDEKHSHWGTVVGVVADVRHTSLEEDPQPQMYSPSYDFDGAYIAVRSTMPPATITSEIRATLKAVDPSLALTDIHTMGDLVSEASARRRFQTSLLTVFAAIALFLALVGLYGLIAYSVNRRTQELGIRMALGAQRSDIVMLVLKNAGSLLGLGLLSGLACAWAATRLLTSFLYGVSDHDPLTILLVCALLLVCGLSAAFVPARRAASIDPMQALRTE